MALSIAEHNFGRNMWLIFWSRSRAAHYGLHKLTASRPSSMQLMGLVEGARLLWRLKRNFYGNYWIHRTTEEVDENYSKLVSCQ